MAGIINACLEQSNVCMKGSEMSYRMDQNGNIVTSELPKNLSQEDSKKIDSLKPSPKMQKLLKIADKVKTATSPVPAAR